MNKNIIPSFASIIAGVLIAIISIVSGCWLMHENPIIGLAVGPIVIVFGVIAGFVIGMFGAWILKPKAERIITADEAGKVVDDVRKARPW